METKNRPEQGKTPGSETPERVTSGSPEQTRGQGGQSSPGGSSSGIQSGQSGPGQFGQGGTGSAARRASAPVESRETIGRTGSEFERGAQHGAERLEHAKESINEAYERTSRTLNDTYDQAISYSRDNPGKTALIAFGVGVGVGLLLANTTPTRSRTRRVLPPVLHALSDIVDEFIR